MLHHRVQTLRCPQMQTWSLLICLYSSAAAVASPAPPTPLRKGSEQRRGQTGYLKGPAVQVVPEGPVGQGGQAVP